MKIIRTTTVPQSLNGFCKGILKELSERYEVVGLSSPGEALEEVASREGVSGYSVPVKDVDQLTQYILQFLRNPEKAKGMGLQGRKWVEERFDQKVFIEKYMENRMELLGIK